MSDNEREKRLRLVLETKRREAIRDIEEDLDENIGENARFRLRNIADILDKAKISLDLEINYQVLQQKYLTLKQIEKSLARLENGQYGLCSDCGMPISEERLSVLPSALHCIECQNHRELGKETPTL